VDVDQHIEKPKAARSGFRHARVRAAYTLPLGWQHLTPVDIDHIRAEVDGRRADKLASLETLETCLIAWSILVTGRPLDLLLSLAVRIVSASADLDREQHGLIKVGGRWGWWLPAAQPTEQRTDRMRAGMNRWSASIYLPVSDTIIDLVERCVATRNRTAAGRIHISGQPHPLFTCGDALRKTVASMLAARHSIAPDRARRATTTPEALGRWLASSITQRPGGDSVPASIITGRMDPVARTTAYYGSISNEGAARLYRQAIEPVDTVACGDIIGQQIGRHAGDRMTPSDVTVRLMIARLTDQLRAPDRDLAERHRAMTDYTVALLAFALAHRGSGMIPALNEVDAETRLCRISDKTKVGLAAPRLVWISDTAFRQLALYEQHVERLHVQLGGNPADALATIRSWAGLPLFDMNRRSHRIEPIDVLKVMRRALAGKGALTANAGRHWLRAQLVGLCSTDTLRAFFGHGPIDNSSWDWSSALDPVIYRADIARVLDRVLFKIGWKALDESGNVGGGT
jgi:hypothetical protein